MPNRQAWLPFPSERRSIPHPQITTSHSPYPERPHAVSSSTLRPSPSRLRRYDVSSNSQNHQKRNALSEPSKSSVIQALQHLLYKSKFFPGANSRVENKKAGQNFYRSDLLKLLVAGTGFEPMTFGLQEQRRPPCFFLFSAFLGIPGLSSARVIRYSLPIFSPIPCWGGSFLLPLFPWRGSLY